MPMLQWDQTDFIGCLEVEPTIGEDQVWHTFEVQRGGVVLGLTVRQYDSAVVVSLALESCELPLIELCLFVREGAAARQEDGREWLELRDCILAGSRFSYIQMGDVFDRRRYPHGHHVLIRVQPQIQVEIVRA